MNIKECFVFIMYKLVIHPDMNPKLVNDLPYQMVLQPPVDFGLHNNPPTIISNHNSVSPPSHSHCS